MQRRARFLVSMIVWLAAAFATVDAHAQAPADVAETSAEPGPPRALPDAPEAFVRERVGSVLWEYPSRASSIAEDLQEVYRDHWPRVEEELGAEIEDALVIRIGTNPEEMRALAPREAPPPAYASGVAYPMRGLVLLTLTAPETWERPDVDTVLVHELSHVALHRAVRGHAVPRWFSEGVAIHQARERSIDRMQSLWSGTVGNRLLPMERLSSSFPSEPHRVNLAYAQSADFVRWLRARDDGDARFREVISRLGRGQSFEMALERTYSTTRMDLELRWHESLSERFQAWPLLLGSGGLWVVAALLIVVAYVRRKRRDRVKFREWEEEERTMMAAARILEGSPKLLSDTTAELASEEREVLYVVPAEPHGRDPGIPTIEHDGRSHTLH